jgi:small conductance mechanosensitive channel
MEEMLNLQNMEQYFSDETLAMIYGWVINTGVNIIVATVILILGFFIAGRVGRLVANIGDKHRALDSSLFKFLGSLARYAVIAFTIIMVLERFGVETTSLVAIIGAAGLAIGLALQGTLSNLAAGIMLLFFRPFKVGDFINVGGESGTVKEICLFTTELATADNSKVIMPNNNIWGSSITNNSGYDMRRLDLYFGVAYNSDLAKVEAVLKDIVSSDARYLSAPAEPLIKLRTLNDSSVDFLVRAWCKSEDYWELTFDMPRKVKDRFDAEGIDIPFPTRTVFTHPQKDA